MRKICVYTAQKMKFSIKDFFSKWTNPQKNVDLVLFNDEILNGKLVQCKVKKNRSMISGTPWRKNLVVNLYLKMTSKITSDNLRKLYAFISSDTNTDLLKCNYFWLEQLNACVKYGILWDAYIRFIG